MQLEFIIEVILNQILGVYVGTNQDVITLVMILVSIRETILFNATNLIIDCALILMNIWIAVIMITKGVKQYILTIHQDVINTIKDCVQTFIRKEYVIKPLIKGVLIS